MVDLEDEIRRQFEAQRKKCAKSLSILARLISGQYADAQDLLQETYLRAYRAFDQYDPRKGSFCKWAETIMVRAYIHSRRKKSSRELPTLDDPRTFTLGEGPREPRELPDYKANPLWILLDGVLEERLELALQRLSPNERVAILLFYVEQYSYVEIAEMMFLEKPDAESRRKSVDNAITRGLKKMRKFLAQHISS